MDMIFELVKASSGKDSENSLDWLQEADRGGCWMLEMHRVSQGLAQLLLLFAFPASPWIVLIYCLLRIIHSLQETRYL